TAVKVGSYISTACYSTGGVRGTCSDSNTTYELRSMLPALQTPSYMFSDQLSGCVSSVCFTSTDYKSNITSSVDPPWFIPGWTSPEGCCSSSTATKSVGYSCSNTGTDSSCCGNKCYDSKCCASSTATLTANSSCNNAHDCCSNTCGTYDVMFAGAGSSTDT